MTLGKWQIDAARSSVGFTVRHMVVSKVHGRFMKWTADLVLDPANLIASKVEATIDVTSVDTRDGLRDGYLRSADFFDPAEHPTIEFRGTGIEGGGKKYKVRGDLTI